MSIRVDSASLISGKTVVSLFAGHGIQSQNIPSTGTSGAGYLYNDIAAQGAAPTDEMRGEILAWPSAGTLTINEDSSFSFTGAPNGSYSFNYRGYRNGVTYGDYTVTLVIGGGASIAYDIGAIDFNVSASSSAPAVSAAASYDIGEVSFSISAEALLPSYTATVSFDIGEIVFAVSASADAPVPQDVSVSIGYDIGAISFSISATATGIGPGSGVGYGVQFIEPPRGLIFTEPSRGVQF